MARKNSKPPRNRQDRRKGGFENRNNRSHDEDLPNPRILPRKVIVAPMTRGQQDYDEAFKTNKIVFGIGPAGTGKTWFAAMRAAAALEAGEIDKIVITRPAVEAGENLGFLPGTLEEKYEPYLTPVRDALVEFFGQGHYEFLIKKGKIDPRPMAYLRGATLKNCWVIADEMQNATKTQLKLLLTRIGENAKFVINGDPSQCDIGNQSGLMDAVNRLEDVDGIEWVAFGRDEIVRDGIIQEIIEKMED